MRYCIIVDSFKKIIEDYTMGSENVAQEYSEKVRKFKKNNKIALINSIIFSIFFSFLFLLVHSRNDLFKDFFAIQQCKVTWI